MSALIRELQARVGVAADGVYGPTTHRAVMAALGPEKDAPTARRVGPRAMALLHHFEGCRLTAYRCPAGVPTIGWGNTRYANGKPVQMGDTITQATADELFRAVLATFEAGVEKEAPGAPAHQFGALVGFVYNVGVGAFAKSTLLRLHKAGNIAGAAEQFLRWDKAGDRTLPGLTRRRAAERLLYLNELAAFDKAIGFRP